MTPRSVRLRIAASAFLLAGVFALLAARAAQLTLIEGPRLRSLADRQHHQQVKLPPQRGEIVDRFGETLALTRESVDVYVRPAQLAAGTETLAAVARTLGLLPAVVEAKATSKAPFVWLDRQVPIDRWTTLAELGVEGIGGEPARLRHYPRGSLAGQVLGFVGIDGQGLEGVERQLDSVLRGEVDALDVERDARGRKMAVEGKWRPLPRVGARAELTIDAALQHFVEGELDRTLAEFRADSASAIVLEPSTGEVLAMANVPHFDPNQFASASPERWRNRIVTDSFEPGSTFKAILAAAALEAGVVRPQEPIYCERGSYAVGRRIVHDHHAYDVLSFTEVIERSSNIGCAKIAERLGKQRFAEAVARFGFGRPTGIDLPGEVAGLVRPVERWGRIHLVTTGFGQGVAVTPLQLARAFAAIANGGMLMRPYVVRRIVGEGGQVYRVGRPHAEGRVISVATARAVGRMLLGVLESGTGTLAKVDGYEVAGKTGTAQKVEPGTGRYSKDAYISSFVGHAPADDPRLVILVMVDHPRKARYGGVVAAPAFRRIAEYGLQRLGVEPRMPPREANPSVGGPQQIAFRPSSLDVLRTIQPAEEIEGVPSFLGLSMREALVKAQRLGLDVKLDGSGYVVEQQPPPGTPSDGIQIALKFGSGAD